MFQLVHKFRHPQTQRYTERVLHYIEGNGSHSLLAVEEAMDPF